MRVTSWQLQPEDSLKPVSEGDRVGQQEEKVPVLVGGLDKDHGWCLVVGYLKEGRDHSLSSPIREISRDGRHPVVGG